MRTIKKSFNLGGLEVVVEYGWDCSKEAPQLVDIRAYFRGQDVTAIINKQEKRKISKLIRKALNENSAQVYQECSI